MMECGMRSQKLTQGGKRAKTQGEGNGISRRGDGSSFAKALEDGLVESRSDEVVELWSGGWAWRGRLWLLERSMWGCSKMRWAAGTLKEWFLY